jgi:general secretion pathway protein K
VVTNERGVALIVTLFIVALVTVLVLEYHFDAAVELELAVNHGQDIQAYHLAMSGVNFARTLLKKDEADTDGPGDFWYDQLGAGSPLGAICYPPQLFLSLASESGDRGVSTAVPETTSAPQTSGEGGGEQGDERGDEGCVSLRIIDEQGKLPVNALRVAAERNPGESENTPWYRIFAQFFSSFEIDLEKIPALVDWVDANDSPSPGGSGAESGYYEGLETPYKAANHAMRSLAELRLVRGFDYETLAKLFPGTQPEAIADTDLGENAYLTAQGTEPDTIRINLNTANKEVLRALFDGLAGRAGSSVDVVEDLVAKRQEEPFKRLSDVNEFISDPQVRSGLRSVADVKSRYFRVESTGVVGPIKKRVVVVIERRQAALELVYLKVE